MLRNKQLLLLCPLAAWQSFVIDVFEVSSSVKMFFYESFYWLAILVHVLVQLALKPLPEFCPTFKIAARILPNFAKTGGAAALPDPPARTPMHVG